MRDDVGKGCHNLLFWGKICAFLELEVSEGTRKREIAVDTAKVDKAAGSTYPRFLT